MGPAKFWQANRGWGSLIPDNNAPRTLTHEPRGVTCIHVDRIHCLGSASTNCGGSPPSVLAIGSTLKGRWLNSRRLRQSPKALLGSNDSFQPTWRSGLHVYSHWHRTASPRLIFVA
jgi:hypothetical protein